MTSPDDRAGFVHVLRALGNGVADVIVVGGWAHRLHALHPLATATGNPLHTLDADLFVPVPDRSSIRVASLVAAGFNVKLGGLDTAPVTEYVLGPGAIASGGIHKLEFLAHRRGAAADRRGRPRVTTLAGDAVAQLLPYLDVMAHEPWTLALGEHLGYPAGVTDLIIRVVAPATYVAHKLMVLPERHTAAKRSQDVRYVYESIMRFSAALDELGASWRRRSPTAAERRRLDAGRKLASSRDLIVAAARMRDLDGREVPIERVGAVIEAGAARLFDD